jgi:hypothetical protein
VLAGDVAPTVIPAKAGIQRACGRCGSHRHSCESRNPEGLREARSGTLFVRWALAAQPNGRLRRVLQGRRTASPLRGRRIPSVLRATRTLDPCFRRGDGRGRGDGRADTEKGRFRPSFLRKQESRAVTRRPVKHALRSLGPSGPAERALAACVVRQPHANWTSAFAGVTERPGFRVLWPLLRRATPRSLDTCPPLAGVEHRQVFRGWILCFRVQDIPSLINLISASEKSESQMVLRDKCVAFSRC